MGEAEIVPLEPMVDATGQPYLPLLYTFPMGNGGSANENSALVKPFRKIIRDGKPIGRINYVFYQENQDYRILGSFAYGGKRMTFFPAMIDTRMTRTPSGQEVLKEGILQHMDHITLDESLRTWHMTLLEKQTRGDRYQRMNSLRVKEDMFLWFVMGVQDASKLEEAPRTQEIRLPWPHFNELQRRHKLLMDARGDSEFVITRVDDEPPEAPYFLNFEFFVSTRKERDYEPPLLVYNAGVLSELKDKRTQILTRAHHIKLTNFSGSIWIRVSKITGTLKSHAVFINAGDFRKFS